MPSITPWIMPGTPTHSKTSAEGSSAAPALVPTSARQASNVGTSFGSTTLVAPMVEASSRRFAEKSAATMRSMPRRRRSATTERPTGPQPITTGTVSAGMSSRRDSSTPWRPTAIGSVIAASSVVTLSGTGIISASLRTMRSL